jgi:hypothetical protein
MEDPGHEAGLAVLQVVDVSSPTNRGVFRREGLNTRASCMPLQAETCGPLVAGETTALLLLVQRTKGTV